MRSLIFEFGFFSSYCFCFVFVFFTTVLLSISGGGPSMTYTDRYVRDMRPLVQVNIAFMCLVPVLSGGAPTVQHVCACIFILVASTLYGTSLAWSICVRVCMLAWMHYCMHSKRIFVRCVKTA